MPIGTIIGFLIGTTFSGALLSLHNPGKLAGLIGNTMFWVSLSALGGTFIEMIVR
jgi:hypothetical protein